MLEVLFSINAVYLVAMHVLFCFFICVHRHLWKEGMTVPLFRLPLSYTMGSWNNELCDHSGSNSTVLHYLVQ